MKYVVAVAVTSVVEFDGLKYSGLPEWAARDPQPPSFILHCVVGNLSEAVADMHFICLKTEVVKTYGFY